MPEQKWIKYFLILNSFFKLGSGTCSGSFSYSTLNEWDGGANVRLEMTFPVAVTGWTVELTFDSGGFSGFSPNNGNNAACNGMVCQFDDAGWNEDVDTDETISFDINMNFPSSNPTPQLQSVTLDGSTSLCGGSSSSSASATSTASGPEVCSSEPPNDSAENYYGRWILPLSKQSFSATACPDGTSLLEWRSQDDYYTFFIVARNDGKCFQV